MVVRFFKDTNTASLIAMPLVASLVYSLGYIKAPPIFSVEDAGPLYLWLSNYTSHFSRPAFFAIGLVLFIAQVFYLNYISNKYEILYKPSHLPALLFIVCKCWYPGFLCLHPVVFVNCIMLLVLELLFSVYKSESGLSTIFIAGFLIAVASLFYVPAAVFFLLLWVCLILLRPLGWRDWIISILGFVTPFYFISIYYFWQNNLLVFWTSLLHFTDEHMHLIFVYNNRYYFSLAVLAFLMLVSILKLQGNFFKNFIRTRRYQQALGAFLLLAGASVFMGTSISIYHFSMLSIPLSIVLGYFFLATKKAFWVELVFLLLVSALVYNYLIF
jgi:hypothetical protein